MRKIDAWKALREQIILNVDVRATYERWGVKFTGKVSSSNWIECFAFGREDKNPSAAVNLTTGVYKDFAGERFSIFDFMVAHGHASTWQEAQETLAKSVGLAKKIPKKARAKRTADMLGFSARFSLASVMALARKYGIDPRVFEMVGAKIARYPASSSEPQIVCAFEIFDPIALLESPPESYILEATNGQPIMVYQGPDTPAKPEKRIAVGGTGIANRYALENWEGAERIYKVEGLSDMLVLQNFIPEEMRKKHLVITNACSCDDAAPAWGLAPHCVGKEIIIIHDSDVPGQFGTGKDQTGGAQRWVKAMKSSAKMLKNVQLPFEIQSKHGKDLRNWIQEPGRKYSDLLELVNGTKDEVESVNSVSSNGISISALSGSERTLSRVGLEIIGHEQDRGMTIYGMSTILRRGVMIPDIDKLTYLKAIMLLGDVVKTEVDPSPDPAPAKIALSELRETIALTASSRIIDRTTAIGTGAWEIDEELVFVGPGEWSRPSGGKLVPHYKSEIDTSSGKRIIDFRDINAAWYDRESIEAFLPHAALPEWRTQTLNDLAEIFSRWDNWDSKSSPHLLACLALCTWIQDIWSWRPWISLVGPSNCGKSTLLKFLKHYFGPHMASLFTSATAAGLRQEVGTSSKAMLLDELEQCPERDRILLWLKGSGGGGRSARGTPGQKSITAHMKLMPWPGSTEIDLSSEPVRNRYIVFKMASRQEKPRFQYPKPEVIETLRSKSLAVILLQAVHTSVRFVNRKLNEER